MSGVMHGTYGLLLLLFLRVVMGIRFPDFTGTVFGVFFGSLFPNTDIIGSPDSLFPVMKIYRTRHYLHSLFFLLTTSSVSYLLHKGFGTGVFIGYGFHLILERIKRKSLPCLWYPYKTLRLN
ncbi:MAG: metal-dependent hydrolase [Clostridia bacterium]|nr:hypothetical protein [Clostridiaceae bacterium]